MCRGGRSGEGVEVCRAMMWSVCGGGMWGAFESYKLIEQYWLCIWHASWTFVGLKRSVKLESNVVKLMKCV